MKRVEESLHQITVKTGSGHSPVCLVHLGGKSGGEIEDREYKHMLQRIPPHHCPCEGHGFCVRPWHAASLYTWQ